MQSDSTGRVCLPCQATEVLSIGWPPYCVNETGIFRHYDGWSGLSRGMRQ